MSVQENIAKVSHLIDIVENHLVGGKLSMDSHINYIFHDSYSGLDGIRVSLEKGKINGLTLLINKLDELYNTEFGWSSHHTKLESL